MDAVIGLAVTVGFLALPVALVVAALGGKRCTCRFPYRGYGRIQNPACPAHPVHVTQSTLDDWFQGRPGGN